VLRTPAEELFIGPVSGQVHSFFGRLVDRDPDFGDTFPITDKKSAARAIDLIIEQGEGTFLIRDDCHYAKFKEIYQQMQDPEFSWWPNAVKKVVNNPATRIHSSNLATSDQVTVINQTQVPLTYYMMVIWNAVYETTLLTTYSLFGNAHKDAVTTGLQKAFTPMMRLVLSPVAEIISNLPAGSEDSPLAGFNSGAGFEWIRSIALMPHVNSSIKLLYERLRDIQSALAFVEIVLVDVREASHDNSFVPIYPDGNIPCVSERPCFNLAGQRTFTSSELVANTQWLLHNRPIIAHMVLERLEAVNINLRSLMHSFGSFYASILSPSDNTCGK